MLFTKNAEDTTLWSVSQFTMNDVLMMQGVYKDKNLTAPHGEFKFYNFKGTNHSLVSSGYYFNGIKYGPWIEYYPDGHKRTVKTLRNDQLNGPYEVYGDHDSIPSIKGQYIKGQKDGEWITPLYTEVYKDGIRLSYTPKKSHEEIMLDLKKAQDSLKAARHFIDAKASKEFVSYMRKKLGFYFLAHKFEAGVTSIDIIFTVGEDGKLSDGELQTNDSYRYENRVNDIIKDTPAWQPATLNGKPVTQRITYTFSEDKATTKMPDPPK